MQGLNTLRISGGELGVVRGGYLSAATLAPWVVSEDGATIRGSSADVSEVACGYHPLSFMVTLRGGTVWRWPVKAIVVEGQTVTLTVGALEVLT